MTMSPRRLLSLLALAGFVLVWAVTFRPTALGGPATFVIVSGHSMEPRLHTGDLVVLRAQEDYKPGDVVTYPVPEGVPGAGRLVIHRIIGGSADTGFTTQGDNRDQPDDWTPTGREVLGAEWFMVPGLGDRIAWLLDPAMLAAVSGGAAVVMVMLRKEPGSTPERTSEEDENEADEVSSASEVAAR